MRKRTESEQRSVTQTTKRQYIIAPVVHDPGYPCPHCGERYGHRKAHKYLHGRQRMLCGECGKPFVVWRDAGNCHTLSFQRSSPVDDFAATVKR